MSKASGWAGLALALLLITGGAAAQPAGAAGAVLARQGAYAYDEANASTVLALYEAVLESRLNPDERARLRSIGVAEFNARPREVVDGYPRIKAFVEVFRLGPPLHQSALRELIWEQLVKRAPADPFAGQTVDLLRRHARVVAEGGGLVVTEPELDAFLGAEDDVARLGGLAAPSAAQRGSVRAAVQARFAGMSQPEQDRYAHAETRRALLSARLADGPAARAKLAAEIRQAVRGPADLERETDALQDRAVQLQIAENRRHGLTPGQQAQLAAFQAQMHANTMALMGFQADSAGLQGVDRAVTQFNSRTYTAPHNAH